MAPTRARFSHVSGSVIQPSHHRQLYLLLLAALLALLVLLVSGDTSVLSTLLG